MKLMPFPTANASTASSISTNPSGTFASSSTYRPCHKYPSSTAVFSVTKNSAPVGSDRDPCVVHWYSMSYHGLEALDASECRSVERRVSPWCEADRTSAERSGPPPIAGVTPSTREARWIKRVRGVRSWDSRERRVKSRVSNWAELEARADSLGSSASQWAMRRWYSVISDSRAEESALATAPPPLLPLQSYSSLLSPSVLTSSM
mmetsp:Transcript_35776/g.106787  ORF Transcript_35776/g.106787 Transcript_35776/m.106787 type:complete len:205 (+) Transcript_35776:1771-2385(+)